MKHLALSLLVGTAALGFVTTTYAADLIIEEPVEVGVVDVSGDWDGVYLGAFVGYGWGTLDDSIDGNYGFPDDQVDLSGWLAGVALGANFTVTDGIVAGVVGDIAWSNITGADDSNYDFVYDVNWVGSVRGRLGFDGGSFLPYLTAGVAFANATADDDVLSDTQTHIGWTVGAGVEVAVADNLSVDLLYRYSDYGTKEYDLDFTEDFGLTTHQVTVGLNWSF